MKHTILIILLGILLPVAATRAQTASDTLMMDYLRATGIPVTGNNRVKLLTTGRDKFADLFDAIRRARHHVHLEYFNFRNDSIANALFDLLAQHRLLASLGSLATGQAIANPAPAPETGAPAFDGSGILTVQTVFQEPALPNGCEAASLATLLEYNGCSVDLVSLGVDYLPRQSFSYSGPNRYGPDPEQAYAGDPASSSNGWYCFEGPIIEAANAWLRDQGSSLRAQIETGADMDRLEQLLRQGTPVAVWFTQDYEQPRFNTSFTWTLPDGSTYTPYGNLHCVVLTGMDENQCYLADPMQGDSCIERDRFESIYTAMGSRAVVLR